MMTEYKPYDCEFICTDSSCFKGAEKCVDLVKGVECSVYSPIEEEKKGEDK